MGVHGLTTLVEGDKHLFQDIKFRDSRLVIDGCSLYFRLYFNNGLDQQHGGDYDAFASLLTRFLSALDACNIQPYVVLDGGIDPSEKKLSTLRQRLQSKIKEADNLSHGRHGCVLPILTRNVFIQILIERGIPLVQCMAEADLEIASLAHQWNCPVLSNDSDFYIFNLPGGYLPLNFFNWTHLKGKASNRYISALRYTADSLYRQYGGFEWELLPLCAVLTGNDYGAVAEAETFLSRMTGLGKGVKARFESLLLWVSSFSHFPDAMEELCSILANEGRESKRREVLIRSKLLSRMQEYYVKPQSSLACWFSGGAPPESQNSVLPDSHAQAAAEGLLPPMVIDALILHKVLLIPQVENSRQASSHCCATSIRRAVYGIMLKAGNVRSQENTSQNVRGGRGGGGRGRGGGGWHQHGANVGAAAGTVQTQGAAPSIFVEEYDRLELNLKKNQVEAQPPRTSVTLDTLSQAPSDLRLGVLSEVLGTKESALVPVPLRLKLAVAVTGFWLREAKPPPSLPQLQALVLGFVYAEMSLNIQPGSTNQHTVQQVNWAAERNVMTTLDRHRVRPGERRGLDIGAAHSFSQWQACLWSALCLNQLLLLPLPEPHLSCIFSGTLVHGLLRYLTGGRTPEFFLSGGYQCGQIYYSLMNAVSNCCAAPHPYSSAEGRRRGRGRGRRGRGGGGRGARGARGARGRGSGTEELNNRFALLMSEEEFYDY